MMDAGLQTRARPVTAKKSTLALERARQTRAAVMTASRELWTKSDFDSVSVDEICAKAGISKGTFYAYFAKKEYLLLYIVFQHIMPAAREVLAHVSTDLNTEALCGRIAASVSGRVRQLPKHLVDRGIAESIQLFPELNKNEEAQGLRSFLLPIFTRARQRGEISKDWDIELLLGLAGWAFLQGLIDWARGGIPDGDLEENLCQRMQIVVRGACTARVFVENANDILSN